MFSQDFLIVRENAFETISTLYQCQSVPEPTIELKRTDLFRAELWSFEGPKASNQKISKVNYLKLNQFTSMVVIFTYRY